MAYGCGSAGEVGSELRVAGRHHPPAIYEYLRADLLCYRCAVRGDSAALGSKHPRFEAQVRGVLR